MMHSLLIVLCFLVFAGAPSGPVLAASFAVENLSGTQRCIPNSLWQALAPYAGSNASPCATTPVDTVAVVVTPEEGELPLQCEGNETAGITYCSYAADVFLAARYRDQWYVRTPPFEWAPVADFSRIPVAQPTGSWRDDVSLGFEFFLGFFDTTTGQSLALPDGTEVYIGIAPAGSRSFTAKTVTRIYPTSPPR